MIGASGRYSTTWRGTVLGGESLRKEWRYDAEAAVVEDWLLGQRVQYETPVFTVLADAGSQSSLSTWNFTATAGAPVGAVVVAAVYVNSNVSIVTSFTDTAGNTWSLQANQTSNAAQLFVYTSTLTTAIAVSDTFTVSMPFSQNRFAATVFRVEGVTTSTPQGSALNSGAATTSIAAGPSSPNLDPAIPRSLVVGVFAAQSGTANTTWSSTTPITLVSQGGTSGATSSNRQVAAGWNVDYTAGDGASSRATSSISSAFASAVLVFPLAVAAAASNVDLPAGSVVGSSSITGAVEAPAVPLPAGSVAGSSSVTGAVTAPAVPLPAGSVAGSSSVTGAVVSGVTALPAGSVAGSSSITGAVTAPAVPLPAGSVAASSSITGAIVGVTPLPAGSVAGSSTITGAVAAVVGAGTPVNLPAGSVVGSSSVTGAVSAPAVVLPAGSVAGSSTISGAVAAPAVVLPAGSVVAASVVSGAIVVGVTLPAGTVTATSSITGAVSAVAPTPVNLPNGTVTASSSITGSVAAIVAPIPPVYPQGGIAEAAPLPLDRFDDELALLLLTAAMVAR